MGPREGSTNNNMWRVDHQIRTPKLYFFMHTLYKILESKKKFYCLFFLSKILMYTFLISPDMPKVTEFLESSW